MSSYHSADWKPARPPSVGHLDSGTRSWVICLRLMLISYCLMSHNALASRLLSFSSPYFLWIIKSGRILKLQGSLGGLRPLQPPSQSSIEAGASPLPISLKSEVVWEMEGSPFGHPDLPLHPSPLPFSIPRAAFLTQKQHSFFGDREPLTSM